MARRTLDDSFVYGLSTGLTGAATAYMALLLGKTHPHDSHDPATTGAKVFTRPGPNYSHELRPGPNYFTRQPTTTTGMDLASGFARVAALVPPPPAPLSPPVAASTPSRPPTEGMVAARTTSTPRGRPLLPEEMDMGDMVEAGGNALAGLQTKREAAAAAAAAMVVVEEGKKKGTRGE